jgi:glycosyltransferase involved in cell wall biosynthesis
MIQDLYPEMYQGHLDDNSILRQKANLVLKANHIVAVSERTKKDVIDFFDIPEEKISVIYHSSSIEQKNEQVLNLPPKYFLYFGERKRYKNFWFFVRAIEPILKSRKDIHVICTGQWLNRNELRMLYDLQILDYFTQTFVEEGNLFEVYNRAIAFVFPSYYEGFGIPILEAFESSCPVLLSDSSCFPEIAKDCALYFPPKDIKRLRFCIEEIIDKPSLRQTLIDKGEKRAKDFSWEKSAAQTHAVYERVLNNEL